MASSGGTAGSSGAPAMVSAPGTGGTAAPTGQLALGLGTGLNVGFAPDGSLVTAGAEPSVTQTVRRLMDLRAGCRCLASKVDLACRACRPAWRNLFLLRLRETMG